MSMSDPPEDLDPRIAGALDKLTAEFQQRLAETREEIVSLVAAGEREAVARAEAAEAAAEQAAAAAPGHDALEEVKQAITRIDEGSSQAEILSALLAGAGRFASRSALFLARPGGLECWGSYGLEGGARAPEGLSISGEPHSPWGRIAEGDGGIALTAADCAALCEPLGVEAPTVGLLLPFILGDQVAAALYADRVEGDGSLDVSALQLLTFSAGQVLETLPVRRRATTATLRLAESAPAAPVEEAAEPETEAAADEESPSGGLFATEVEPPPAEALSGVDELPEIDELPEVDELPDVVLPEPVGFQEVGPAEEPEADSSVELVEPLEPPPGFESGPEPEYGFDDADLGVEAQGLSAPAIEEPVDAGEPRMPAAADDAAFTPEPPPAAPALPDPGAGGSSTQVAPPEDVQGPGWAFTTTRISPEVGEEAQHEEARRLARLLVTEIKLYNEEQVQEGRLAKDIYSRLREDIERSQQIYNERIGESVRSQGQYFREALVRILCGGDESALGA